MFLKNQNSKKMGKLITFHLLPGIALSLVYIVFLKMEILDGYPRIVILGCATFFSILPIELGCLFYVAKKEKGTYNLFKILGLKSKMKAKELVRYVLGLMITGGILLIISKPLSNYLLNTVFCWIPEWYNFIQDLSLFRKKYIVIVILVDFFVMALIVPVVEELYFRGFLLARMKWMGKYGVLLNVVLFSIYHFYTPWLILTKIVTMLPLYYFVYKKDSLKLGIWVHCLGNLIDVVSYVTLLL